MQNTIYMELGVNKVKTVIDCSTKKITTIPLTAEERNELLREEEKNITKEPTAQERIDALEETLLLLMMEV